MTTEQDTNLLHGEQPSTSAAVKVSELAKKYWYVVFDSGSETFRLKAYPLENPLDGLEPIKRLCAEDLTKFDVYRHSAKKILKKEPNLQPTTETRKECHSMYCVNCSKWFRGLCYKHPLVFIHEKIPAKKNYLCNDTFPPFMELAPSTIKNAGKGVFTTMPLPAGLCFGPYAGILEQNKDAEVSGYSWRLSKDGSFVGWIDANSMIYSNWMRYVNCPRFEKEQNMLGVLHKGQIYYVTYRPIEVGEELMVWYGREYGVFLGVPNAAQHNGLLAPKNKELQKHVKKAIGGHENFMKRFKKCLRCIGQPQPQNSAPH